MVEERPVTSGRLNLCDREVVSSIGYKVRIDFAPDPRLLSISRSVFRKHFLTGSFEAIWMTGDRVVG